ncbi:SIMPL domain-containing protein [Paenibacillus sp. 7124]|uniref:SIMPL domain-containing protein n=1 Tax=Paenibacillus apii TaxID=1850370 RepID=A0A6M1PQ14_9BACL|nr:SIMPL domain-containing protein [Paenibacillus apii]NGM85326.1 SIMPL domain-containing protein [Paenibacillus apii]NJJ41801.1 SIMPL domain-containing protein [Paenibacillus apii]
MKKWIKSVLSVFVAGSLMAGGVALSGAFDQPEKAFAEEVQKNIVSVVGKGELSMKPDIVYLSIGVDTSASTAQEAQKTNGAKIQKLTALFKNTWGINGKDIQTSEFFVQPNYTYNDKEGQQVKGYNAHHVLQVAYRDLNKVGSLLDAASEAGANNIGNARFAVEDTSAFEAQVIEKAMANADVKAAAIAKAAKRTLGQVLTVSQNDGGAGPILYEQNAKMMYGAADSAASTAVQPGEVKITTQLNVIYQLN